MEVRPGIRRVVANNPGPLTYHGTNTYLITTKDDIVVIDPGPAQPEHVAAILDQAGGPITRIGITHGHSDHVAATAALVAATGATTFGYHPSFDSGFVPDVHLGEHDSFVGMRVIHTPGHAPDHLCFARTEDGILFAGDHVMGWSTTFVGAPIGNMSDYLASLRRMLAWNDYVYLPGHGPALETPRPYIDGLLTGRMKRERQILAHLQSYSASSMQTLLSSIYPKVSEPRTLRAAERTLLAHLLKLQVEGLAVEEKGLWMSR